MMHLQWVCPHCKNVHATRLIDDDLLSCVYMFCADKGKPYHVVVDPLACLGCNPTERCQKTIAQVELTSEKELGRGNHDIPEDQVLAVYQEILGRCVEAFQLAGLGLPKEQVIVFNLSEQKAARLRRLCKKLDVSMMQIDDLESEAFWSLLNTKVGIVQAICDDYQLELDFTFNVRRVEPWILFDLKHGKRYPFEVEMRWINVGCKVVKNLLHLLGVCDGLMLALFAREIDGRGLKQGLGLFNIYFSTDK